MNIFRLLFELLMLYLLYKLIFNFIIPVYRTSKQVRRKMNEMQEQMKNQQQASSNFNSTPRPENKKSEVAGDYIDYEEIK